MKKFKIRKCHTLICKDPITRNEAATVRQKVTIVRYKVVFLTLRQKRVSIINYLKQLKVKLWNQIWTCLYSWNANNGLLERLVGIKGEKGHGRSIVQDYKVPLEVTTVVIFCLCVTEKKNTHRSVEKASRQSLWR